MQILYIGSYSDFENDLTLSEVRTDDAINILRALILICYFRV